MRGKKKEEKKRKRRVNEQGSHTGIVRNDRNRWMKVDGWRWQANRSIVLG